MLTARDAELAALEADVAHWYCHGPFTDAVARLAAYRGVASVGALTIAGEVGDWRRFPAARTFMGFTRVGALGVLLRRRGPAWTHHQGRQPPSADPADRVGVGVSASPQPRREAAAPPGARRSGHRRPVLERSAASVWAVPASRRPQEQPQCRRRGDRPGNRRVPVGRDDGRLNPEGTR
jgi:transposase